MIRSVIVLLTALAIPGAAQDFTFGFQAEREAKREAERAQRDYERGMRHLDKREYERAVEAFDAVGTKDRERADGALYWKAFALGKLGRGGEARAALQTLAKSFPDSRWGNDAKALDVELAQASGQPVAPERESDEELKLVAINSLLHSDPERSIPLLEGILQKGTSPKLRERALFVLSQSDSPKAREVVARIAKGAGNPDLQLRAIRNLGVFGNRENRTLLADIYGATQDVRIKKEVLHSYMVSGERDRMLGVAKSEQNPELRKTAIHWLGTMGASAALSELYNAEQAVDVREQILHSLFISGQADKLLEVARTEKNEKLKTSAIHRLGMMGRKAPADALVGIYSSDTSPAVRRQVINGLFIGGNAAALVQLARKETNMDLKRDIVQKLSLMKSKEATDYMLELLK